MSEAQEECPRCAGSGRFDEAVCPLCHGSGFLVFEVAQLAKGYRSLIRNAMTRHLEVLEAAESGRMDKASYFREIRLLAGTLEEHGFKPLEILTMPQKYLRMMVEKWRQEDAAQEAGGTGGAEHTDADQRDAE
jgi:hypothetical protein